MSLPPLETVVDRFGFVRPEPFKRYDDYFLACVATKTRPLMPTDWIAERADRLARKSNDFADIFDTYFRGSRGFR